MSRSLLKKRRDKAHERGTNSSDGSQGSSSKMDQNTWIKEDSLFQDHVREVLEKFDQIDPEIWGKIIYMERNRRIAKAYARSSPDSDSIIRITNEASGFDGTNMSLRDFENSYRDLKTMDILSLLGEGIEIVMNECGSISIRNTAICEITMKGWNIEATGSKSPGIMSSQRVKPGQSQVLFDIDIFLDKIEEELTKEYPARRRLELETLSVVTFGIGNRDLLDTPSWLLVINMVAIDVLKSKIPHKYQRKTHRRPALDMNPISPFFTDGPSSWRTSSPVESLNSSSGGISSSSSTFSPSPTLTPIYSTVKSKSGQSSPTSQPSGGLEQFRSHSWTSLSQAHKEIVRLPTPDYEDDNITSGRLAYKGSKSLSSQRPRSSSPRFLEVPLVQIHGRSHSLHNIMKDNLGRSREGIGRFNVSSNKPSRSWSSQALEKLEQLGQWHG